MEETASQFEEHIIVVGVGLIGGSIAAAVRDRFPKTRVTGVGRDASRLKQAQAAGLLTDFAVELTAEHLQGPAIVVVCLPVDLIADFVIRTAAIASDCVLFTDAGSVKAAICDQIDSDQVASRLFVGSHPIAGGEQSGHEHADALLFQGRVCVVVPVDPRAGDRSRFQRACRFWEGIGCSVREMEAEDHDRVLGLTSHLPHIMAAVATSVVGDANLSLTGSGFRDTTRIAAGNAVLWRSILTGNRAHVVNAIGEAQAVLDEFKLALARDDDDQLEQLLRSAAECRVRLSQSDSDAILSTL